MHDEAVIEHICNLFLIKPISLRYFREVSLCVGKYDAMKLPKLISMSIMNDKSNAKTVISQTIKATGIPTNTPNIREMLYLKCHLHLY